MSQKIYDCIVVGAGAAGMISAISAARGGADVLLIEGRKTAGSKLLQTGNGKCNFTNYYMETDAYNNPDKAFVERALKRFNQYQAIDFFESIGVFHKERNGYVYPHSETAASLRWAIEFELSRLGVRVVSDVKVTDIKKKDIFYINDTYMSQNVIIAAGSKAAPKTGSDGSGYELSEKMGHTVVKPLPALVQLISDSKACKVAAGVRSTGVVTLNCGDSVYSEYGEIQYTDYGISGIPVFQISRFAVSALDKGDKVYAVIDMIPDYSQEQLMEYFYDAASLTASNGNKADKTIEYMFSGILNRKLIAAVCISLNINPDTPAVHKNESIINNVVKAMKNFRFNLTGFKSFDSAQVCQGGVTLDEINAETMESKLVSGLYFAGEIMDVDGKCGGYNLQWAWTSGYIAGKAIADKVKHFG